MPCLLLHSVARARDILSDIKVSKGRQLSSRGRMQDVLLQAIHQAQSIIETKLNGVSFCQEYVALGHLIQRVESCKENTGQLRSGLDRVSLVYVPLPCVVTLPPCVVWPTPCVVWSI